MSPLDPVNQAFSKQSTNFDAEDHANPVIKDLRQQIYQHVSRYIKSNSSILELNAGTGIDAEYFLSQGHSVYATDLSDGMIAQLEARAARLAVGNRFHVQQLSYDHVHETGGSFDFAFSNFGGLNCIHDLRSVADSLEQVLKPGAFVTLVIMPVVCPWEMISILKGNTRAFRRFHRDGVMAHLEGHYFRTWYFSKSQVQKAFANYKLVQAEGLAAISPPPHRTDFPVKYPRLYHWLRKADGKLNRYYPFNSWADHVILTFRYK